jgi:glutaconate CoA-transferase subunit B
VITDLGVLEPNPASCELVLRQVHPGVEVADVVAATGWPLQVAERVEVSPAPTEGELTALRALKTAEQA